MAASGGVGREGRLVTAIVQSAITIVLFIFMLGALVVIHELGHFIVARLAKIRVHEFGIGFPPRARILKQGGETLYTLNWLPIGGFVRLEGEDGDSDDPRSFTSARLPVKLAVLIAGVLMNLLLAFAIFFFIAWLATPLGGVRFDGVQPDSPASQAGLVAGDMVISIDGQTYDYFGGPDALLVDLRAHAGSEVALEIKGTDGTVTEVTPTLRTQAEIDANKGALGITGLRFAFTGQYIQQDPLTALRLGVERTVSAFAMIIDGLGQLASSIVTNPTGAPPVSGPVGIAVQVGDVFWQLGPIFVLYLAGLLSANLALFNILPFPPLDGGRIVVTLIKSVAGSRLSIQAERLTYLVGFVALFGLMIWITFFDVVRQIGGGATP
jgi:regulator of sigma E protease